MMEMLKAIFALYPVEAVKLIVLTVICAAVLTLCLIALILSFFDTWEDDVCEI